MICVFLRGAGMSDSKSCLPLCWMGFWKPGSKGWLPMGEQPESLMRTICVPCLVWGECCALLWCDECGRSLVCECSRLSCLCALSCFSCCCRSSCACISFCWGLFFFVWLLCDWLWLFWLCFWGCSIITLSFCPLVCPGCCGPVFIGRSFFGCWSMTVSNLSTSLFTSPPPCFWLLTCCCCCCCCCSCCCGCSCCCCCCPRGDWLLLPWWLLWWLPCPDPPPFCLPLCGPRGVAGVS